MVVKALFRNNVVLFKHFCIGNELESAKLFLNDKAKALFRNNVVPVKRFYLKSAHQNQKLFLNNPKG